MENRYKLMSSLNVKNVSSYNNKVLSTISSGRKGRSSDRDDLIQEFQL